jgi:hypothetical protein
MKIRRMIEKIKEKVRRNENENMFEMKYIFYEEIEDVYKNVFEMFDKSYNSMCNEKKYLERENECFGYIMCELKRNERIEMFMNMYLEYFKYLDRNIEYEKEIKDEIKNDKLFVCVNVIDWIYEKESVYRKSIKNKMINIKRIRINLLYESELIYII